MLACFLFTILVTASTAQNRLEPCTPPSNVGGAGGGGICRLLHECPEAQQLVSVGDSSTIPPSVGLCAPRRDPEASILVCCVNRGIFFPGAPSPSIRPITTPVTQTTISVTSESTAATLSRTSPTDTTIPVVDVLPVTESALPAVTVTKTSSNLDISNPFEGSLLPECGYRVSFSPSEVRLPIYDINGFAQHELDPDIGEDSVVNAWPWVALIGYPSTDGAVRWACDGSLINSEWVITAAHCFDIGFPVTVRLGEHDHSDDSDGAPHQDFGISLVEVYPQYNPSQAYHDLALIKLDRPVNTTDSFFLSRPPIVPVCLPWGEESGANLLNRTVALTGWGATEHGGNDSPVLQAVHLTIFDSSVCDFSYRIVPSYATIFPNGITDADFLCAGHQDEMKDACHSDPGGPLVYNSLTHGFVLIGLVPKGHGCGLQDFPGVYTTLNRPEYLSWIKSAAFS